MFAPPGCSLANPFAAREKRHPRGVVGSAKSSKQAGSLAGTLLEFQFSGMVVPAVAPL
jgi:hypothetical protein